MINVESRTKEHQNTSDMASHMGDVPILCIIFKKMLLCTIDIGIA